MNRTIVLAVAVLFLTLSGCGYNTIQNQDEGVKSAHAQVLSVYKKRADLIPNLVEVVKGFAAQEKSVLVGVTEARAKATQVTLPADATPQQMKAFLDSQKALGASLGRLLAVAEAYPQLKSDVGFLNLQRQLDEVESQATAARNKYIRSIRQYNITVRSFPVNLTAMFFGYKEKPQMQFEDEQAIKKTPQVKF
ncbi:MAG: LemA family protein [bacterium]|nr:LemA family protein [bacterium]